MRADIILLTGILVFISSLISLRVGLSVAIIEILPGVIAGNSGIQPDDWMLYLASFGGILLTFLAGTEIDTELMKDKFKESFLIGTFSFLIPFVSVFLYTYFIEGWNVSSSLIAGTALSETSIAVVYSVLVETGLSRTDIGKFIMASTFMTDMGTAIALSILFVKPTLYTAIFIFVSLCVIYLAGKFSHYVFHNPKLKNKVIEPEIKYIFLLLFMFMFFANIGNGQAVLPAFVLGLVMSKHFKETTNTKEVRNRLRTVAYAVITPIFFIVAGLRVSLPMIISASEVFAAILIIKQLGKFIGVYFLAKKYIPEGNIYTTLLMSTGLSFGLVASLFGVQSGLIDQVQYSILTGVLVASAVIPTFIAQKWFMPVHSEDLVEINNGDNGNSQ